MPTIILITGVTGVGKTTFAGVLDGLKLLPEHSLTPDKIAKARKIPEQKAVLDLVKEQRGFCYEMKMTRSLSFAQRGAPQNWANLRFRQRQFPVSTA